MDFYWGCLKPAREDARLWTEHSGTTLESVCETNTRFHMAVIANSASTKASLRPISITGIFLVNCLQTSVYDKCYKMRRINFLVLFQDGGKVFEKM